MKCVRISAISSRNYSDPGGTQRAAPADEKTPAGADTTLWETPSLRAAPRGHTSAFPAGAVQGSPTRKCIRTWL